MRLSRKTKVFPLLALMLAIGAFLVMGTTAYAKASEQPEPSADTGDELLTVKEVWLTGDTMHVSVTDSMGEAQALELNLSDYAQPADEYVNVQATDSAGNTSNTIQFKNPYYTAEGGETESAVEDEEKPFTPDGSGTVIDDATDGDGKEFFTVDTPDGNTFYLIVDRQRSGNNVYLLDAVNENDLAALAKPGDGKTESAVETPIPTPPPETTPEPTPEPAPEKDGSNTGIIVFVVIVVLAVGGTGYYFKIVRPKQSNSDDYASEDDFDNDTEPDLGGDEDGDDE